MKRSLTDLIDDFITDHCMEIPIFICKKYNKTYACKMIATLQAIYYCLLEVLTPPEIKQIRFITRECVSKIISSTRDKDGHPISGLDVVP